MLEPRAKKEQYLTLQPATTVIDGDQEKLWRVFSNPINNAIKFSPKDTTVTVKMWKEGGATIISVQDQGKPEEVAGQNVQHVPASTEKGYKWGSLFWAWLSIALQIVNAHKGRMWFESSRESGTCF